MHIHVLCEHLHKDYYKIFSVCSVNMLNMPYYKPNYQYYTILNSIFTLNQAYSHSIYYQLYMKIVNIRSIHLYSLCYKCNYTIFTHVIYILVTFVNELINAMKDRIRLFLDKENKTSSQFAEEIGIQASGVSHVLSGRNKPSLDFILKMLKTYNDLNSDWLLFGEGEMYKTGSTMDLFDEKEQDKEHHGEEKYTEMSLFTGESRKNEESGPGQNRLTEADRGPGQSQIKEQDGNHGEKQSYREDKSPGESSSERIIVFHGDGTYSEYKRRK